MPYSKYKNHHIEDDEDFPNGIARDGAHLRVPLAFADNTARERVADSTAKRDDDLDAQAWSATLRLINGNHGNKPLNADAATDMAHARADAARDAMIARMTGKGA